MSEVLYSLSNDYKFIVNNADNKNIGILLYNKLLGKLRLYFSKPYNLDWINNKLSDDNFYYLPCKLIDTVSVKTFEHNVVIIDKSIIIIYYKDVYKDYEQKASSSLGIFHDERVESIAVNTVIIGSKMHHCRVDGIFDLGYLHYDGVWVKDMQRKGDDIKLKLKYNATFSQNLTFNEFE